MPLKNKIFKIEKTTELQSVTYFFSPIVVTTRCCYVTVHWARFGNSHEGAVMQWECHAVWLPGAYWKVFLTCRAWHSRVDCLLLWTSSSTTASGSQTIGSVSPLNLLCLCQRTSLSWMPFFVAMLLPKALHENVPSCCCIPEPELLCTCCSLFVRQGDASVNEALWGHTLS